MGKRSRSDIRVAGSRVALTSILVAIVGLIAMAMLSGLWRGDLSGPQIAAAATSPTPTAAPTPSFSSVSPKTFTYLGVTLSASTGSGYVSRSQAVTNAESIFGKGRVKEAQLATVSTRSYGPRPQWVIALQTGSLSRDYVDAATPNTSRGFQPEAYAVVFLDANSGAFSWAALG